MTRPAPHETFLANTRAALARKPAHEHAEFIRTNLVTWENRALQLERWGATGQGAQPPIGAIDVHLILGGLRSMLDAAELQVAA